MEARQDAKSRSATMNDALRDSQKRAQGAEVAAGEATSPLLGSSGPGATPPVGEKPVNSAKSASMAPGKSYDDVD